jgi:hypothetical protein
MLRFKNNGLCGFYESFQQPQDDPLSLTYYVTSPQGNCMIFSFKYEKSVLFGVLISSRVPTMVQDQQALFTRVERGVPMDDIILTGVQSKKGWMTLLPYQRCGQRQPHNTLR